MIGRAALCVALFAVIGCTEPSKTPEKIDVSTSSTTSTGTMTKEKAIAIARKTAEAEYDLSRYLMKGAEFEAKGGLAGTWRVWFEAGPKAAPGEHFAVYVNSTTAQADLVSGQ